MTVVRRIDEEIVVGKRLGRHVEHDPRSRNFPAGMFVGVALQPVLHKRHARPLDQGALGSCTGNATAGAVDTEPLYRPRHLLHEPQAIRIYSVATGLDAIDGTYPPDDTGSSGLAACKAAVQLGYLSSYHWAFGIDAALAALQLGPVITGVDWHEGFDDPDQHGRVRLTGQVRGGHEFEVIGYDPQTRLVLAVNSWGSGWGERGRFTFSADDWAKLLDAQGDVTVPVRATALSGAQDAIRRAGQPTPAEEPAATSFPLPGPTVEDTRITYDAGTR